MPLDVPTFLAKIAAERQRQQDAACASSVPPPDLELPESLEVALRHRFLIRPVLARSMLALNSAGIGVPPAIVGNLSFGMRSSVTTPIGRCSSAMPQGWLP